MSAPTNQKAVKEGWLTKQGGFIKTWKKRFFRLFGKELHYLVKPNGKEMGVINLGDAKVVELAPECRKQPAFKIVIPGVRTYYIVAETQALAQDWISVLEKVRGSDDLPVAQVHAEDFDVIRVIGRGTYGKVQLVRNKNDGQLYAMKTMSKKLLVEYDQIDQTLVEKDVLLHTVHPFLVGAHFTFQSDTKIFMILDYVPGGELFGRLKEEMRFPEERVRLYAAEIVLGLGHLHSLGFIYRDLKPENILLDAQGHLRITDFGLVKTTTNQDPTTTTFCGTPEYIAPEMLENKPYDKSVDWWSFGILLFEMFTGLPPFYNENTNKMYRAILHDDVNFPLYMPNSARDIISRLLDRNPETRLGSQGDVEEIKRDNFFAGMDWQKVLEKRYNPGYVPEIKSETDTGNFGREFTEEEPVISFEDDPAIEQETQNAFAGFTCVSESKMGGQ